MGPKKHSPAIKQENGRVSKIQNKKRKAQRKRAKSTATNTRAQNRAGPREVMADERLDSSVVIMNEKQMAVADNATAKGIVSLYNHGFVPKRTGKVSNNSKFAASKRPLYQIEQSTTPILDTTRIDINTMRTVTENDDLDYSFDAPNEVVARPNLGQCL